MEEPKLIPVPFIHGPLDGEYYKGTFAVVPPPAYHAIDPPDYTSIIDTKGSVIDRHIRTYHAVRIGWIAQKRMHPAALQPVVEKHRIRWVYVLTTQDLPAMDIVLQYLVEADWCFHYGTS